MELATYHGLALSDHEIRGSTPTIGLCPGCHRISEFVTIGAQVWYYCTACHAAWHVQDSRIGDGTTEEHWKANRRLIDRYTIVAPSPCQITRLIHELLIARGQVRRSAVEGQGPVSLLTGCPECDKSDGQITMPFATFGFCNEHRVTWETGRKNDGPRHHSRDLHRWVNGTPEQLGQDHEWKLLHSIVRYHRVGPHAPGVESHG